MAIPIVLASAVPANTTALFNSMASSLGVLQYLPEVLGAAVIGVVAFIIYKRKHLGAGATGAQRGYSSQQNGPRNRALLISLKHRSSYGIHFFTVKRVYDPEKNVEEARAIFAAPAKSASRFAAIKQFMLQLIMRKPAAVPEPFEDRGVYFSESVAHRNELGGWDTIFTLEENLQMPMVMGLKLLGLDTFKETFGKAVTKLKDEIGKVAVAGTASGSERLEKLNALHESGALTDEEYNAQVATAPVEVPTDKGPNAIEKAIDKFADEMLKVFGAVSIQMPIVTDNAKVKEEMDGLVRATDKRVNRYKQLHIANQNFLGANAQMPQPPYKLIAGALGIVILFFILIVWATGQLGGNVTAFTAAAKNFTVAFAAHGAAAAS